MNNDNDISITDSTRGPVGDGRRSDKPETVVQVHPCRPKSPLREVSLAEVLEGAKRAEARVAKWPKWKQELSRNPSKRQAAKRRPISPLRSPSLAEVLEGAKRAEERMAKWPKWMQELSRNPSQRSK